MVSIIDGCVNQNIHSFIHSFYSVFCKHTGGTTQTETSTSYLMNTAREFPLYIPFIDKNFDNNISPLQATDLTCDLQKIDIPISLQRLERFLEKI